mgnify:CR=1 FL=1
MLKSLSPFYYLVYIVHFIVNSFFVLIFFLFLIFCFCFFMFFLYNFVFDMKKILAILLIMVACGAAGTWAAPEPVPAVAESVANVASVKGGVGVIYFAAGSNDATFNIYAITGQLIKSVKVNADSHVTIEMPKGFYIVRYNNQWSRKVVVK